MTGRPRRGALAGPTGRSKPQLPAPLVDGETLLRLGRTDSHEALDQLREFSPDEIAGALQELRPSKRYEFLETAERIDEIIPLFPEAEFTSTVVGAGIEETLSCGPLGDPTAMVEPFTWEAVFDRVQRHWRLVLGD